MSDYGISVVMGAVIASVFMLCMTYRDTHTPVPITQEQINIMMESQEKILTHHDVLLAHQKVIDARVAVAVDEVLVNRSSIVEERQIREAVDMLQDLFEQDFTVPYEDRDYSDDINWFTPEHGKLIRAISIVESNNNPDAVGDGGRAAGAFQIWDVCWQDAVEHDPSIGGSYEDVYNYDYARKILIAYWDRYGYNVDHDLESLARIWNGGPRGYQKSSTEKYWSKVQNVMNRGM